MSSDAGAAGLPGLLLVLSAPSGAGKTTIAHRYRAGEPDAVFSISATTRAPRGAERDGVDYHFVTPERFAALVAEDALAEWAEVHGRRYGTLRATVDDALRAGKVALFDIDVQGGSQLKRGWPDRAATIFILPPTPAELEQRLRARGTEDDAAIARRLAAAREEIARGAAGYDYLMVNDVLEEAVARVAAIARHERLARAGRVDPAAEGIARACRRGVVRVPAWGI
ncbi:MAG: guanylate kinase [Anaeromyxobacter sp.]